MSDARLSDENRIEQRASARARKVRPESLNRNVTSDKKLQEGQRQLYRSIMGNSYVAIALMDLDYKILIANETIGKKFNKPVNEIIGRECFHEFEKRQAICPHCPGRQAIETGEPAEAESEGVRDDGSRFPVRIQTFPAIEPDGAVIGFVEIIEDITERKKAEEALSASELKYRTTLNSMSDAIHVVDADLNVVLINDRFFQWVSELGIKIDFPIGQAINEIFPFLTDRICNEYHRVFKYGKVFTTEESNEIAGKRIITETRKIPIYESGRVVRVVTVIRDITKRKQAEQKLLEDKAQLKFLASQLTLTEERERREIATELHDRIGQSLVISKIKLDQLRKSVVSEEFIQTLSEVCNCLEQVIQDTRTLTFDLSSPILYELGFEAAVAEWLDEQIREKYGINTEFVDDRQSKPLDDDIRVLLFRNVRELLINVVKHSNARNVKVSISRVDKRIIVTVEDDGIGFDSAEAASKAAERATFGLFSIRERLEQLEGYLEIKSAPGHGSRITMTAPLKCENIDDKAWK